MLLPITGGNRRYMIQYRLAPSPCHPSSFSKIRKRLSVASTATTIQTMVSTTIVSTPFRSAIHCSPSLLSLDTLDAMFRRYTLTHGRGIQFSRYMPPAPALRFNRLPFWAVPLDSYYLTPWNYYLSILFSKKLKKF